MREPTSSASRTRRPSRNLSSVRVRGEAQGRQSTNALADVTGWLNPRNATASGRTREAVHATGRYYRDNPAQVLVDVRDTIDPRSQVTQAAESGDWGTVALIAAGMLPIPGAKALPAAARAARAGAGAARRTAGRVAAPRTAAYAATPEMLTQTFGEALDPAAAAKLRSMGSGGRTATAAASHTGRKTAPKIPDPDSTYTSPRGANAAWQRYVTALTEHNTYRRNQGLDPIPLADRDAINGRKPLSPAPDPQESRGVNSTRAQVRRAEADLSPEERATILEGQRAGARRRTEQSTAAAKAVPAQSPIRPTTGVKGDPYLDAKLTKSQQAAVDEFEAGLPRTPTGRLTKRSKDQLAAFRSQMARAREANDKFGGLPRSDIPDNLGSPLAPQKPVARPELPRAAGEVAQEVKQAKRFKEAGVDLAKARKRPQHAQNRLDGQRKDEWALDENGKPYKIQGADDPLPGALDPRSGLANKAELDRQKDALRKGKKYETERDVRRLMDDSHRNRMSGEMERSYAPGESTKANQPDNNFDLSERSTRLNPKRTPGSRKLRPRRKSDKMRTENPAYSPGAAQPTGQLARQLGDENVERLLRRQELAQRELDEMDRTTWTPPERGPNGRPFRDEEGDFWATLDPRHPDFEYWLANRRRSIARGTASQQDIAAYEELIERLNKGKSRRKTPNSNSAMWGETQTSAGATTAPAKPKPKKPTATKPAAEKPKAETPAATKPKKPAATPATADTAAARARNMEKYRRLEADGTIPKGSVARFEAGETWNEILADAPKAPKPKKPAASKPAAEAPAADDLLEQARALSDEFGGVSVSYIQRKLKIKYAKAQELADQLRAGGAEAPKPKAKPKAEEAKPTDSKPAEGGLPKAPAPPVDEMTKAGVKKPAAKPKAGKGDAQVRAKKMLDNPRYAKDVKARAMNIRREDRPAAELARRTGKKIVGPAAAATLLGGGALVASRWDDTTRRDVAKGKAGDANVKSLGNLAPKPATAGTTTEPGVPPGRKVFTTKDGKKFLLDKNGRRISLAEFQRREKYRREVAGMDATQKARYSQAELDRRARYRKGLGAKAFGRKSTTTTRKDPIPEGMPVASWRSMSPAQKKRYKQVNR